MPSISGPTSSELEVQVREHFPSPAGAARVGMELEALPVRATTHAPVPLADGADGPGTLGVLRRVAASAGWNEVATPSGMPNFLLRDGARLSYEPGGQLEWSSARHDSLDSLDRAAHDVCRRLGDAMGAQGIELLARGVDPVTPTRAVTMLATGERYTRQLAHYDRAGDAGRAMMLQTAGIHLNLDAGIEPVAAWNVANTLAPLFVAMFANAPKRAADASAHRSHRAAIWRTLDRSRTAVFAPADDPVPGYLAFALGAESFLLGDAGAPARTFAEWCAAGATQADFARHLTTLFPEVRPRGTYLELRSVDALPVRWAILPMAIAWTVMHHAALRTAVLRELPPPSVERLSRAGRYGLGDDDLAAGAQWLAERVPAALGSLAPDSASLVERLEAFVEEFTLRRRDPGHLPATLDS